MFLQTVTRGHCRALKECLRVTLVVLLHKFKELLVKTMRFEHVALQRSPTTGVFNF